MPKRNPIKILPSAEYLRECLDYDAETGVLVWKERPRNHFLTSHGWLTVNARCAGKIAGSVEKSGYRIIVINKNQYFAQRVIWKWMTGEEPPPSSPDHEDRDKLNNRWSNLRAATTFQQTYNSSLRKTNTSGYRGVNRNREKWQARITINGVRQHLGLFDTAEEGSIVYESVAREVHGEFYQQPAPAGSAG